MANPCFKERQSNESCMNNSDLLQNHYGVKDFRALYYKYAATVS